jgi:hypothetical protein
MVSVMKETEERTEADLRAWDWRAELRAQERSVPWLARHTHRSDAMVYKYSSGKLPTPVRWLREAARVLGYA